MPYTSIKNAQILIDGVWTSTDLAIENGKWVELSSAPSSNELDATGFLLLPGAADLHVHFNEPGRTRWEGFATGSLSAAAGGNTFVAEMPLNSIPSTVSVSALQKKLAAIGDQSHVDFGLWGGLVPGNAKELRGLAEAGVVGFKAFMSPSGTDDFGNSDVATLREGMLEIAKTGKRLAVHAEDPAVLKPAETALKERASPFDWEASRPIEAEMSAVRILIDLSQETQCPVHVVHVSSFETLELIAKAKSQGVEISCETCPHYLLLSIEDASRIGPAAKCAPPLRPQSKMETLWESLRKDMVDTIGSDHSPCPPELKAGKPFYEAWGGISGLQHGLPLLWSKALNDPALFQKLIALSSSNPSALIGLSNKGSLKIGTDADFVLAKASETHVQEDSLLYRHRQSAYCGQGLKIEVAQTWLRGECIYRDGRAAASPKGRFIPIS